jgi:hypothetical protein
MEQPTDGSCSDGIAPAAIAHGFVVIPAINVGTRSHECQRR